MWVVAAVLAGVFVLWLIARPRRDHGTIEHDDRRQDQNGQGSVYIDVSNRRTGKVVRLYPFPGYMMEYVDAEGVLTRRPIFIVNADRKGKFDAYCFLRKDMRTFLESAVISLERIRGNEPVTDIVMEIRKYNRA